MSGARKASYFIVAYVFSFVLIYVTPSFKHRSKSRRAFFAYYKDPTPENESELRYQQRMNEYFDLEFAAVGTLILVTIPYGVYRAVRLASSSSKSTGATNSRS